MGGNNDGGRCEILIRFGLIDSGPSDQGESHPGLPCLDFGPHCLFNNRLPFSLLGAMSTELMHMSPLECHVAILDVCPIYTYVVCLRFVREGLISSKVANFRSGSKSGKKVVTLAPVLILLHTIILFSRKNTNFGLNLNRGSFFLFVLWKSTSFRSGGPNLDRFMQWV